MGFALSVLGGNTEKDYPDKALLLIVAITKVQGKCTLIKNKTKPPET